MHCSGTNIHCVGDSNMPSSSLTYHIDGWGCIRDGCCPPSFYDAVITCDAALCVIDCVTTDCLRYYINATAASTSLVVNCGSKWSGNGGMVYILYFYNIYLINIYRLWIGSYFLSNKWQCNMYCKLWWRQLSVYLLKDNMKEYQTIFVQDHVNMYQ